MKKLLLFSFIGLFSFLNTIKAQTFTAIDASSSMVQVTFSQVSWVDYDGDGDLDAFVFGMNDGGTYQTALYQNKGSDQFTLVENTGIPDLAIGSHAWADYDGDGDMDLLIQGADASVNPVSKIMINQGNGTFTDAGVNLDQVYNGNIRWMDFNNDGYLDIILAGFNNIDYETFIYQNNGDGTFTKMASIVFPGVISSTIEWADYDKDGDQDFIFMGIDFSSNFITTLYKNNGDGTFSDAGVSFPQAWLGDAAWGDYNNDGYPDLVISGFIYPGRITNLYKNNGDGTFSLVENTPFDAVSHSALEWGDYNNDGNADLFLAGKYENDDGSWTNVTKIFENNGDGTFTEAVQLTPVNWGDAAWGDYNNDGKLDLIQSGYDEYFLCKTVIYRNDSKGSNTPPEAPTNLTVQQDSTSVTLIWDAANDTETPSEGLSYNVYLYRKNGDTLISANAILSSGFRLIPALGNTTQNNFMIIDGLTDGTYFWSVQAIDNAFAGSVFAAENSFTVDITNVEQPVCISSVAFPNPVKDRLVINSGMKIIKIVLTGINGQTILTKRVNNQTTELDMSHLPQGVYFLTLESENDILTKKIVKQ